MVDIKESQRNYYFRKKEYRNKAKTLKRRYLKNKLSYEEYIKQLDELRAQHNIRVKGGK